MDSLDTITLLAFLAALMRLDNSLPADLQNQLNEIGKTFPSNVSKLHALAKSYSPLEQGYKNARLALQKDGERFRFALPEPDESSQLSDGKIIKFAIEVLNANDSVNLVKKADKESSLLGQFLFQLQRQTMSELGGVPVARPYPSREVESNISSDGWEEEEKSLDELLELVEEWEKIEYSSEEAEAFERVMERLKKE